MNWLAHFVLSNHQENLIVGNWLGEFVRGKKYENYPPSIAMGILMHREIDSFTDEHPIVKKATKIFQPHQRKYAPIVVDLFFDYFLFQNWERFETLGFEVFKNSVYEILQANRDLYSRKTQVQTQAFIEYDWLQNYTTLEGLQKVLIEMGKRTHFVNHFDTAIKDVHFHEKELNEYFLEFFPQLQEDTQNFIKYYDIGGVS